MSRCVVQLALGDMRVHTGPRHELRRQLYLPHLSLFWVEEVLVVRIRLLVIFLREVVLNHVWPNGHLKSEEMSMSEFREIVVSLHRSQSRTLFACSGRLACLGGVFDAVWLFQA